MLHHATPAYIHALDTDRAETLPRRPRPDAASLDALVAAAARGDDAAWNDIVARFGPQLYRIARRSGLGSHEAQDAVQETWLQLLRNLNGLRDPEAVGGWLATTVRHESFRQHRRFGRETPEQTCPHVETSSIHDDLAELSADECRAALERALAWLSPLQRSMMTELLAETSYTEIARRLDMPIGSIGPTRARCFARLRLDVGLRQLAEALD